MRIKTFINLLLVAIMLVGLDSCQESNEEVAPTCNLENKTETHAISIEEALSNLDAFLKDNSTRTTISHPTVVNVIPMRMDKTTTRAMTTENAENVIYVANFSCDQGFAVLAADDRIKDKIIAVTDDGNITKEDIDAVAFLLKNNDNYVDKNYPTTGNGLFTVKDYPGEVFLNPNTFSTYDESMADNWVGNFSEEDSLPVTRAMSFPEYNNRRIALSYCVDYAMDEVTSNTGGSSSSKKSYISNTTFSDWKDAQRTNNILGAYVRWDQKSPFNDLYPKRRRCVVFGNRKKAPAGCFPLSIAKVLTYFRRPGVFSYNGNIVDWNALSNVSTPHGKESAAVLLKGISESCGSMYFWGGTFTFPSKASSFLGKIGYDDVKRFNYSYNRVSSMINKGCPVIIYAVPGIKVWKSHAWIIDGYKVKVRQKITRQYENGKLINTITIPDTCRMVHCDFGWGRLCNGYYVDGVFKLNSDKNDYDYPWMGDKKTKFNHHIRIITYNNPQ